MQQSDFTDSFIKSMLGWIRWIASSIANMFQSSSGYSSGSMSKIAWFADNWIKILIGLIVVGVVVDWLVWMARWRPYWVWFRRRRILLDNDIEGIDDDDLMLHYGDVASRAAPGAADYDPSLEEFEDLRGYDEDEAYDEDGAYDDLGVDEAEEADEEDFDALYDDRYGDYAPNRAAGSARNSEREAELELDEDVEEEPPARGPSRAPAKRRKLFSRPGKRPSDEEEEDPFSIEGDFFDDLEADPMEDLPPARGGSERTYRDASIFRRPGAPTPDEADEDGERSGYTRRLRRRKQDADA